MNEYPLGRLSSPFDPRDYNLKNYLPKALGEVIEERKWDFPAESLNQESTPHCVGFSMADFGINLPINTSYVNQDGHNFYYMCKVIDGDPDGENGSYVRTAAKVLKNIGKIDTYAFARDMETLKWWLLNRGALIVGTIWTNGMFEPDQNNVIHPTGSIAGGHAYILNEWRKDGYIGFQNSWGNGWGVNGKAYISAEDFAKLLYFDGEVLASVELEKPPEPEPVEKPWWKKLWEKIVEFFKRLFEK
jgi:hypothetical protein